MRVSRFKHVFVRLPPSAGHLKHHDQTLPRTSIRLPRLHEHREDHELATVEVVELDLDAFELAVQRLFGVREGRAVGNQVRALPVGQGVALIGLLVALEQHTQRGRRRGRTREELECVCVSASRVHCV